jgi:hypothetical protein
MDRDRFREAHRSIRIRDEKETCAKLARLFARGKRARTRNSSAGDCGRPPTIKRMIRKSGDGFPSRQTRSVCAEIMLKQKDRA